MHKKIIVSFPPVLVKTQKEEISNRVNITLESIHAEIAGWNGFVDFVETAPGHFELIAQCDNYELRDKMQALINADAGKLQIN